MSPTSNMMSAIARRAHAVAAHCRLAGPLLFACLLGTSLAATGCENRAIGRTCTTLAEDMVSSSEAVWNDEALECPTRLCVRPAEPIGLPTDTAPFCTAECNSNADCEDHETRDAKVDRDKRCKTGFTCGAVFDVGPLKCKKMCLCRDFVENNPAPPAACPTN